jgi:hypothetical protein
VIRRFAHLATRFLGFLRARPLTPAEQANVAHHLAPMLGELFWSQQPQDQRHALECLRHVVTARPGRLDLARAALLHDVGKRHARLGVLGRSTATLLESLHFPTPGRFGVYLRHDALGAADLEAAGADRLSIAFAASHRGRRPPEIDPDDWTVLRAADGG